MAVFSRRCGWLSTSGWSMKNFRCVCGNPLYFENTHCVACGHTVGYLPERRTMSALEPAAGETWRALAADHALYRMCGNYSQQHVCNWMVAADDPHRYCRSCRLNRLIPDLTLPHNHTLWYRVETAKRRLLYTLYVLGLPVQGEEEDPQHGLAFAFLADDKGTSEFAVDADHQRRVLTGHGGGLITINIAEADPSAREQMREQMQELYRTLLGHFRHESGHYYWDLLVRDSRWLGEFRGLFGDERRDYGEALRQYYATGNLGRWRERHISAYASMHPWEDWAETWAHYLHMIDTLETAADAELAIAGHRPRSLFSQPQPEFDDMKEDWIQLTLTMNAVTRSLGLSDAYPFVFSDHAAAKLHFVHDLVQAVARRGNRPSSQPSPAQPVDA